MSQKPDLQVNAHSGIGAWECPGRCLIKLLPERQGAISVSLPVLYFGSSIFSPPTTHPRSSDPFAPLFGKSPTHRDRQHCDWCLTHLASLLSEFDRSVNDSLFPQPPYHWKTKSNSWESRAVIFEFSDCTLLWEIHFSLLSPLPSPSPKQSTRMGNFNVENWFFFFPQKLLWWQWQHPWALTCQNIDSLIEDLQHCHPNWCLHLLDFAYSCAFPFKWYFLG